MQGIKRKTYYSAPTYKQINSILKRGWKLTSFNSATCLKGEVISKKETDTYSFFFEKCTGSEEFYCLQYFIGYTLWSEEQYQQAVKKLEEYKKRGAYIISAYHATRGAMSENPALISSLEGEGEDLLYYIFLQKERVNEQDEESSYDAMLKFLGFSTYSNALHGLLLFVLFTLYTLLISFLSILVVVCFFIKDCYYFLRYRLYRKKEYSLKYFMKMLKN